jgi:hypothetical protein
LASIKDRNTHKYVAETGSIQLFFISSSCFFQRQNSSLAW